MSRATCHPPAFTLIELLVVMAIIGILAALLLPVLSKGKQRAEGVLCLNSGRQMMTAMTLYGDDNHGFFPPNEDGGNTIPGHNWCSGDVSVGGADEFNPDILRDPSRSLLIEYLSGDVSLFHCPGDKRTGLYQGTNPQLIGQTVPAARTFSMNNAVGTICHGFDLTTGNGAYATHSGIPDLPVNGPWLNNQNTHRRNSPWATYGKFSSIKAPGPSMLWVLLDEDVTHINDAAFCSGMEHPQWFDVPGTYHNLGCGFAFADGHSEAHKWRMAGKKQGWGFVITDAADKEDWFWLRERTSVDTTGTMPAPQ